MANKKVYQAINLAAILIAGVVLGIVAVEMYQSRQAEAEPLIETGGSPVTPQAPVSPSDTPPAPSITAPPVTSAASIQLSHRGKVIAAEFLCPCGCGDSAAICVCEKRPGATDIKGLIQGMVDQGKPSDDIRQAIVDRFGTDATDPPAKPETSTQTFTVN